MTWLGLLVLVLLVGGAWTLGLLPMQAVRLQLGALLAADTTTLAPAVSANKIALINAAFTPTENMTIGSLSFATFTGSSPKVGAAGTQGVGIDPATGEQLITILAPAGGWRFVCTVAPATPETIFGFALTDNAGAVLLGVELLPNPITIAVVNDEIDLGAVAMTFVLQPLS